MMRISSKLLLIAVVLGVAACQPPQQPPVLFSKKSPVELRAMQTRSFAMPDRQKAFRVVIATLQDLGYSIEKVEPAAGSVTADKLSQLRMTATVNLRGTTEVVVRANAEVKPMPTSAQASQVDDPDFYLQDFFEPLSKALFLTALQVEDPPDSEASQDAASQKAESAPSP
jgi:uncharacterized lipoprotein